MNKVYVGNLPFSATDADLRQFFADCGTVTDAIVISDRETGRSKGFGFVTFDKDEGAERAMSEKNGQDYDGRRIRVDAAKERR